MNPARGILYHLPSILLVSASLLWAHDGGAVEKPVPIFDGQTFNGWVKHGGAIFTIEDGVIVGKTGDRSMGWLCTDRSYGDFILELEVKITDGNSGIQIRSRFDPEDAGKMVGDQVEVDMTPRAWSGGLYDQGRRGWLQNLTNNPAAQAAFKTNEWNKYRIVCEGDAIKTWVNGVPATDHRDAMDVDGFIALQVHSGAKAEVRFRNLRLQDQGRHEWKRLWNGKTMEGWHMVNENYCAPSNCWQLADGMIRAKSTNIAVLVLEKPLSDFAVRLRYQVLKGTGAVQLHSDKEGKGGLGIELSATDRAGSLRGPGGHGRTVPPFTSEKWFKPADWNTMHIYSHGAHLAVDVGRHRATAATNIAGPATGHLALELPPGQDSAIDFKDIEILEKSK